MNATWIQRTVSSRYAWSILAGLGLAASFPKIGVAGLAWVTPGCLLFSAIGQSGGAAFRIGYVGGFAFALGALHWLLFIPFPAGAIAGWVALSAYVALYFGAWVWICWKACDAIQRRVDRAAIRPDEHPQNHAESFREAVRALLRMPLWCRIGWVLSCALVWVALEMVLARLFTGFPWNLLGASQYQVLPLIQIASVTGVYGVSFLVVWFAVALTAAALRLASHMPGLWVSRRWLGDLALPLIAVIGVLGWGVSRLNERQPPGRTLKAVLIQPSIPQTLIWDTNQNAIRFEQLIKLSERALGQTPDAQLLVWPEAAVPNMLRYEWEIYRAVTNLVMTHRVWMVLGSDDAAPRPGSDQREFDYYNSSFLVNPRGEIAGSYRKRRLVIFGEYVPLQRWLPFMKYLTPIGGSFAAGEQATPFVIPGLDARISVLICFEDIFPHLGPGYVEPDTDFLLNLTNNGWFGESAAQWQHAANAVFRTVENRTPLVRCANNGLTCWVDAYGGMHDVFFPGGNEVYSAGFKAVDVPLLGEGQKRELTFYTRRGDAFGWSCVAITISLLAWSSIRAKNGGRALWSAPAER